MNRCPVDCKQEASMSERWMDVFLQKRELCYVGGERVVELQPNIFPLHYIKPLEFRFTIASKARFSLAAKLFNNPCFHYAFKKQNIFSSSLALFAILLSKLSR